MRFALVFLGVCLLTISPPQRAGAQSIGALDDLLRATREASGSPYQYHLSSTSHEKIDGVDFELTSESEGSRYLIRRCAGDVCNGLYVDGERTSVVNINGTALPLPIDVDPLQSSLRAVATGAFTAPEFQAAGGRVERESDAIAGNEHFPRLVVATAHGSPLDVTLDGATHLVRSVGTRAGKVVFTFKDYRRVDQMMLPFEIDVNGQRNQVFDRRARVDGALEAPAGLVPQMDGATSTTMLADKTPIVPCSIASAAATCLIDTGNSGMVMSADLAHRLGLKPQESVSLQAFGSTVTGIVHAGALHIAGATYPPATYVVVTNLHGSGADLALGADFFAHTLVTVDYPAHTVTVAPETAIQSLLPISFENFVPITGAGVGDQAILVSIDTGDEDAMTLPLAFVDAHSAIFSDRVEKPNGDASMKAGPLRLGSFVVGSATATGTKLLAGSAHAHLGSDFLRHFRVTFDYAHSRIAVTPLPGDRNVKAAP